MIGTPKPAEAARSPRVSEYETGGPGSLPVVSRDSRAFLQQPKLY